MQIKSDCGTGTPWYTIIRF